MQDLIFPKFDIKLTKIDGKLFVFDPIRKKKIVLTAEEWIRQHAINYLIEVKQYPKSRISVEKELKVNGLKKRTDLLIYDANGEIFLLAEFKNADISLHKEAEKQIMVYNTEIKASIVYLCNGREAICFDINQNCYLDEVPVYSEK